MTAITIFIFAWGIYLIYMTVKMKASGVIPRQMLSNKINLDSVTMPRRRETATVKRKMIFLLKFEKRFATAERSLSYMPRIIARVPPLTPGTVIREPIVKPFRAYTACSVILF